MKYTHIRHLATIITMSARRKNSNKCALAWKSKAHLMVHFTSIVIRSNAFDSGKESLVQRTEKKMWRNTSQTPHTHTHSLTLIVDKPPINAQHFAIMEAERRRERNEKKLETKCSAQFLTLIHSPSSLYAHSRARVFRLIYRLFPTNFVLRM